MKVADLFTTVWEALCVRRVFGEPIERNGVTVIPVASIRGAGGLGGGHDNRSLPGQGEGELQGEGGGFAASARPVGVYAVKDGNVKWIPTIDLTRLVTTFAAITIVTHFAAARRAKARSKQV
jgi:uncharacterized spore protein YtfJ